MAKWQRHIGNIVMCPAIFQPRYQTYNNKMKEIRWNKKLKRFVRVNRTPEATTSEPFYQNLYTEPIRTRKKPLSIRKPGKLTQQPITRSFLDN